MPKGGECKNSWGGHFHFITNGMQKKKVQLIENK
jgi:hypothetical protein